MPLITVLPKIMKPLLSSFTIIPSSNKSTYSHDHKYKKRMVRRNWFHDCRVPSEGLGEVRAFGDRLRHGHVFQSITQAGQLSLEQAKCVVFRYSQDGDSVRKILTYTANKLQGKVLLDIGDQMRVLVKSKHLELVCSLQVGRNLRSNWNITHLINMDLMINNETSCQLLLCIPFFVHC